MDTTMVQNQAAMLHLELDLVMRQAGRVAYYTVETGM